MVLVIVGASGKLGFATLTSLLDNGYIASEIVCTTSSDQGAQKLSTFEQKGGCVRRVNWDDDHEAWQVALSGCDRLFLISSARINKDFDDAPLGKGREEDHFRALEAARDAGVEHVYYTSLAFANPSRSRVMTAHERTEAWLKEKWSGGYTIIREGLYNESWPLYFGYYYELQKDARNEVVIGGDSEISWTSIADLGLANATILAAPSQEWDKRTLYLAQKPTRSLHDVAELVSKAKGQDVKLRIVSRTEHEAFYTQERGMPKSDVTWWSYTYDALRDNECEIDDHTLEQLLAAKGRKPKQMEETVAEMMRA